MPPALETLPPKGTYTLIIKVDPETHLNLPRKGTYKLKKGHYAYTGSALGQTATSLKQRVHRHLEKTKKERWHIDYLLANKNTAITAIIAARSNEKMECTVNQLIKSIRGSAVPITGFGSSDCKQKCRSHLIYLGNENCTKEVMKAYTNLFERENVAHIQTGII